MAKTRSEEKTWHLGYKTFMDLTGPSRTATCLRSKKTTRNNSGCGGCNIGLELPKDNKGNNLEFVRYLANFVVVIGELILEATGLVRFCLYVFDAGFQRRVEVERPVPDVLVISKVAKRMSSEVRLCMENPANQAEDVLGMKTIKRGEFYSKSRVKDEPSASVELSLTKDDPTSTVSSSQRRQNKPHDSVTGLEDDQERKQRRERGG
ncbi:uncharacterized protein Z518_04306 [Rhinocladiella mackenziei CBS 650.93]|uniref:Uncharacterized protein n=1 Tax=Rhinocladiella mackenziei CBS 650.93 TaxID=1442369 RepID=A0A0D2JB43_9EURO|nr:uncharacterized protein Z518_04306 [Rhinocladiella mackenziei CBS 650.93]KIX06330.1 hypothetical protein Z518_04306 [Rhinocladiella mackenziei CBS 650.93]